MDEADKIILQARRRIKEMQPQLPAWAKAEHIEIYDPDSEYLGSSDELMHLGRKRRKKIRR